VTIHGRPSAVLVAVEDLEQLKRLLPPLNDRYSARRGTYRVICRIDDAARVVTVVDVDHRLGDLVPLLQRRRFVSRAEFTATSRSASVVDPDAFRADQEAAAERTGKRL
jgi:ParE toxin of type II toxin-antitoxin system, parDE